MGSIRNHMSIKTNKATASGSAIVASAGSQKFVYEAEPKQAAKQLMRALDRGNS